MVCPPSQETETWSMQLTDITTEDIAPVKVDLIGPAEVLEVFLLTDGVITIQDAAKGCSLGDEFKLQFNLTSDVVGSNEQFLTI